MPENPPRCRTHKIFLIGNNFSSKFLRYSSSVFQLLKFYVPSRESIVIHCAGYLVYPFNLETHFSVLGNLLEEFDDFCLVYFSWNILLELLLFGSWTTWTSVLLLFSFSYVSCFQFSALVSRCLSILFSNFSIEIFIFVILHFQEFL